MTAPDDLPPAIQKAKEQYRRAIGGERRAAWLKLRDEMTKSLREGKTECKKLNLVKLALA